MKRDVLFAVLAAAIALLSLAISAVVSRSLESKQAAVSARLQRVAKLQDEMLRVQFTASDELNYSALYQALHTLHADHPRAAVMMEGAGTHFYKSYLLTALSSYNERVPEGLENLIILQSRLQKFEPLFSNNFPEAVARTADIRAAINREKESAVKRIIEERTALQLEGERLGRKQSGVQFLATSVQLLSILLVLVKDAFKPKPKAG